MSQEAFRRPNPLLGRVYPRACCLVCRREFAVNASGLLRFHRDRQGILCRANRARWRHWGYSPEISGPPPVN